MEVVLVIAYLVWSYFVGHRLLTDRFLWLEEPHHVNKICKIALCLVIGYFIGGLYLIYLLIRLLWSIF